MVNTINNPNPAHWTPSRPRTPVFAALCDWFARHWPRRAPATPYDELTGLDAHTLGVASGAWQHW